MTSNQLRNLLNFTILFSGVDSNCRLEASSPDYIWEKYTKMIGLTPNGNNIHLSGDANQAKMSWYSTWGGKGHLSSTGFTFENTIDFRCPLASEQDQVINYLSVINTKDWELMVPSEIVEEFTKHIGDPNSINEEIYRHLNPRFVNFISKYSEKHKRDLVLTLFT